jgi:V/A-type H+-transporting ATPase subunit D
MTTARSRTDATRMGLVRARRRLEQVQKGAALLKRKRESLVSELFRRARPAMNTREAIEAQARAAWHALLQAYASQGAEGLKPFGWPTREVTVDLELFELWGLKAAALSRRPSLVRSIAARGVLPGAEEAASQSAARAFEELLEQLVDAAPQEQVMRRLGQALSRTTRLVNTLEQRVAVQLKHDMVAIRRTLEEREREDTLRLKRLLQRRTRR